MRVREKNEERDVHILKRTLPEVSSGSERRKSTSPVSAHVAIVLKRKQAMHRDEKWKERSLLAYVEREKEKE